jgi:ribonuclease E
MEQPEAAAEAGVEAHVAEAPVPAMAQVPEGGAAPGGGEAAGADGARALAGSDEEKRGRRRRRRRGGRSGGERAGGPAQPGGEGAVTQEADAGDEDFAEADDSFEEAPSAAQPAAPADTHLALPTQTPAPAASTDSGTLTGTASMAEPIRVPVIEPARQAPAVAQTAQSPAVEAAPLDLEQLAPALSAAGIELAQTDPAKLAAVQERIAREDKPQRIGRERPPRAQTEEVPLVQVQTRN